MIKKNFKSGLLVGMNLLLITLLLLSTTEASKKSINNLENEIAMSADPFLGEIVMFAGNFAPRGWAFCDGQLLAISNNQALFSILGTTYGGDGRTSFALPDLRGRVSMHPGNGPGLSSYGLGQKGGAEQITLTQLQMPSHNHGVNVASTNTATESDEANAVSVFNSYEPKSAGFGETGGNQPIDIRQPYQNINYIIALQGVFPSRN